MMFVDSCKELIELYSARQLELIVGSLRIADECRQKDGGKGTYLGLESWTNEQRQWRQIELNTLNDTAQRIPNFGPEERREVYERNLVLAKREYERRRTSDYFSDL